MPISALTTSSGGEERVPSSASDWDDWVSASATRNHVLDYPLLDWLERYAEAAHIVPLGGGYDGPDDEENILCLCPNHHAAFDHGGIYVLDSLEVLDVNGAPLGELTVASDHPLNAEHLAAHRRRFGY